MEYILTKHANKRMKERSISERLLHQSLLEPTQMLYDNEGRILIKKLYTRRGSQRILLIAAVREGTKLRILTIIDTSKVSKYL